MTSIALKAPIAVRSLVPVPAHASKLALMLGVDVQ